MSDHWVKEAERRGDEIDAYNSWIDSNEDWIIESYQEQLEEFPEHIYEGVLDGDYQDAEELYLQNMTIDDVPDDYISNMYDSWCEDGGY